MHANTLSESVISQIRGTKTAEAGYPLENKESAKVQKSMNIKKKPSSDIFQIISLFFSQQLF